VRWRWGGFPPRDFGERLKHLLPLGRSIGLVAGFRFEEEGHQLTKNEGKGEDPNLTCLAACNPVGDNKTIKKALPKEKEEKGVADISCLFQTLELKLRKSQ